MKPADPRVEQTSAICPRGAKWGSGAALGFVFQTEFPITPRRLTRNKKRAVFLGHDPKKTFSGKKMTEMGVTREVSVSDEHPRSPESRACDAQIRVEGPEHPLIGGRILVLCGPYRGKTGSLCALTNSECACVELESGRLILLARSSCALFP
jgi:hypothetical protein